MLDLYYKSKFKRDLRLMQRRGKDAGKLWGVVEILLAGQALLPRYRDHRLSGDWEDFRECHIEPDWLLVYEVTDTQLILVRTGTHADLF